MFLEIKEIIKRVENCYGEIFPLDFLILSSNYLLTFNSSTFCSDPMVTQSLSD